MVIREDPAMGNLGTSTRESPPFTATGESPRVATKTQHSQRLIIKKKTSLCQVLLWAPRIAVNKTGNVLVSRELTAQRGETDINQASK